LHSQVAPAVPFIQSKRLLNGFERILACLVNSNKQKWAMDNQLTPFEPVV
jgi:hypothetical protein